MSSIFSLPEMPFLTKLREANIARQEEWTKGEETDLMYRALELGGEVGELLNKIKKLERQSRGWVGSKVTYEEIAEEIADGLICLDLVAEYLHLDLAKITEAKFNKTSEKYGLKVKM